MLDQEELKSLLVYDEETGVFTNRVDRGNVKKGQISGCVDKSKGYREIRISGAKYLAHRLVFLYLHGKLPTQEVDHINRNRDDNSAKNLRLLTRSQNACNSGLQKNNTSGIKGVYFNKQRGKYQAQLTINGKVTSLGRFNNIEEATAVVQERRNKEYGDFSYHF